MVDSVNSDSPPKTAPTTDSSSPAAPTPPSVDEVSAGYSDSNSMSHAVSADEPTTALDAAVELDPPATNTADSGNFLETVIDSKLQSFKAAIANVNEQLAGDEIDLSALKNLLMVIKGVVHDNNILLVANTIAYNSDIRTQIQVQRMEAVQQQAELNSEISLIQEEIDSTLEFIESETDLLDNVITSLRDKVSDLRSQKASLQASLEKTQELLALAEGAVQLIRQAQVIMKQQFDGDSLETGDDKRHANQRAHRDVEAQRLREEKQRRVSRQNTNPDAAHSRQDDSIEEKQGEETSGLLPKEAPVSQNQLDTLATLFPIPAQDTTPPEPDPNPEQVDEFLEGLAVVLQATPPATQESETASEKQPVNQSHLGDNRSLEGADNPQAFSLLLLEKNKERLRENVEDSEQLSTIEQAENNQIADLMGELEQSEIMVTEALSEAEQADAVIRRSPV